MCSSDLLACRSEGHPDHRLAGLDLGLVSVLQHFDLLHCPVAAAPVQLFFGPALEAFLVFLVHDHLLDFRGNQGNSIYLCNQRIRRQGQAAKPDSRGLALLNSGCQS